MYLKLAYTNVKKSFKDYAIYFLTLTLSVCVFYVFNAIESQQAMMIVSETTNIMMRNLADLIGMLSAFVAVVLGFLILYANKYLVKRRKKEIGLYMTLGMPRPVISFVFLLETFMIGMMSLLTGILLGVILSQALSVFTAKLFGAQMRAFEFVFSVNGLWKSILCFVVIYIIVMLFNSFEINKCKLIDLIYANKKNETPKVKSLWVAVATFIVSIICLATSYIFIIRNGLMVTDFYFFSAFVLAFIGTFLFFMSLSGFMLKIMQGAKKLYYRDLNMFVFRQINSKINTTYISMTFICLMLAVTIVTLSSGMAMNQSMRAELTKLTPYDVSFIWERSPRYDVPNIDILELVQSMGLDPLSYASDYQKFQVYEADTTYQTLYKGQDMSVKSLNLQELADKKLSAMRLSDFNKAMRLRGEPEIQLNPNQVQLNATYGELAKVVNRYMKEQQTLAYMEKEYDIKAVTEYALFDVTQGDLNIVMILPDEAVQETRHVMSILNMNYITPDVERTFVQEMMSIEQELRPLSKQGIFVSGFTRHTVYDMSIGLSAIMTYLTVYISIIFLITSAAILALQQLTETEDNEKRYQLLRKLGVDQSMIYQALFGQIAVYFLMPLALAIVHGVVGIYVSNRVIMIFGEINVLSSIVMTAIIFLVIYGAYFVGTYLTSRHVIRAENRVFED